MRALWGFLAGSMLYAGGIGAAAACNLGEIQKADMRQNFCRSEVGVMALSGCTAQVMQLQAADQFEQIALARRCGFQSEADQLDKFYKQTTPLIASLYACVDKPIDREAVEKLATSDVDARLKKLPEGCSDELRSTLLKRLPKLITIDEKSYTDARHIAEQLELEKK